MASTLIRLCLPVLLVSLLLASCALLPGGDERGWTIGGDGSRTTLEVENYHWADVRIYAVASGSRQRLGQVGSQGRETFDLTRSVNSERDRVFFEVVPLASNQVHRTPYVQFNRGDRLVWRVENQLSQSALVVR